MTYELQQAFLFVCLVPPICGCTEAMPRCCIKLHRANLPIVPSLSFPLYAAIPAIRRPFFSPPPFPFFSFLSSPLLFSRREGRTKRVSPLSLCAQLFTSLELQLSEERKWKKSVGGESVSSSRTNFLIGCTFECAECAEVRKMPFFSLSVAVRSQDFRYFSNPFDFQIINFPSRSLELGEILFKRGKI